MTIKHGVAEDGPTHDSPMTHPPVPDSSMRGAGAGVRRAVPGVHLRTGRDAGHGGFVLADGVGA